MAQNIITEIVSDFSGKPGETVPFTFNGAEMTVDLDNLERHNFERMIAAGVPCAPGYLGADQADATLVAEAKKLGYPLLVKAVAGGGGRGMRLVRHDSELQAAIDDELYI